MRPHQRKTQQILIGFGLFFIILSLACSLTGNVGEAEEDIRSPTDTPTPIPGGGLITPAASENRCAGLSGTLEMQVLVGPADAVGLEPIAVGEIPFSVISEGGVYLLQGSGNISYEDVLTREWGTYTVSLDMGAEVQGNCGGAEGSETLDMLVTVSGEQMVDVEAEGFQGQYPWSGSHELSLNFPVTEGATAEGEGWAFILHLND